MSWKGAYGQNNPAGTVGGLNLTYNNLFNPNHSGSIAKNLAGTPFEGYELFRLKLIVAELVMNEYDIVAVKVDNEEQMQTEGANAVQMFKYPGARVIRTNYNNVAQRGSFRNRKFFIKPTITPLTQFQPLTNVTATTADDWRDYTYGTVRWRPFNLTNSPTLNLNSVASNVLWRIYVYFEVTQFSLWNGTPEGDWRLTPAARNRNLIKTEVEMHKCGATDVIDLSNLELDDDEDDDLFPL